MRRARKRKGIKSLPVRVTKKGKKVGRPSNSEYNMSAILSYQIEQPDFKNLMRRKLHDLMIFGTASWSEDDLLKSQRKGNGRKSK